MILIAAIGLKILSQQLGTIQALDSRCYIPSQRPVGKKEEEEETETSLEENEPATSGL